MCVETIRSSHEIEKIVRDFLADHTVDYDWSLNKPIRRSYCRISRLTPTTVVPRRREVRRLLTGPSEISRSHSSTVVRGH